MTDIFDYIVIGAGSAGCPVASRLSADPKTRVLLLEAGPKDRSPWIHVPIGYYRTITSKLSWGYHTDADDGTAGRRHLWPRGKVLGGSSSINGLLYIRGQKEDYDHWRQLGNEGWGYEDVLPFFRKAENQEQGEDDYHGVSGPLGVSDIRDKRMICDAFITAAEQAGVPRNDDFNGATQEGVGHFQTTTWNARRCSAAVAYLKPVQSRANLKVETGALVQRLCFDAARRVTGVDYHRNGADQRAAVRGEIVVSGGAVNSPQLLQLSGIGPGDHLQSHGIDVIHNSPGVGRNLQDHYQARMVYELNRPLSVNDDVNGLARRAWTGLRYALFREGPMTFGAGHVGVFMKVLPESATPDAQVHFIPFSANRLGGKLHPFSGITASVCLLRPESRGEIMIKNSDPKQHPRITPNYLATDYDRKIMVEGLKKLRTITRSPAFAQYVKRERDPGDSVDTNERLLDFVKNTGTTIFHPTSTCRMGKDPKAVVDARLRVHGVTGVRVADCSVMPTVPSGNTNAPAIMVGEKCAHMILETAND